MPSIVETAGENLADSTGFRPEMRTKSPREEFAQLFEGRPEYAETAARILAAVDRNDQFAASYVALFPEILRAAEDFSNILPQDVSPGVAHGTTQLVSDTLYAVSHHLDNVNSTEDVIRLRGGKELPVVFHGSQPAELLSELGSVMRRISEVCNDSDVTVTKAVDAPGFRIYRFIDLKRPGLPAVHAYIRPRGDEIYDPTYEYGRPSSGVEASISLVVDSRSGEMITGQPFLGELNRLHAGPRPDSRVSLRLDREGVKPGEREVVDAFRSPVLREGTLAFDAGSVLGARTFGTLPLGTRLGRLLAWGNVLASEVQGRPAGLNHSTVGFDEAMGRSEVFASQAEEFEAGLAVRSVCKRVLAARLRLTAEEHAR